ncbi:MAG: TonB-dependent receptor [Bryobacteraceae bacterium]|nr:TonB-dependent receptor [Bryobacteraceae bacterium]
MKFLLVLLFAGALAAQNRSTISGAIRDSSGAAVADAAVSVVNEANGVRRNARTDDQGAYHVSTLPAGQYKVTIRKAGFRTVTRPGIVVGTLETAQANFELQVGAVQESITVQAATAVLHAEDASARVTFGREPFEQLPLETRGLHGVLDFAPGVLATPATGGEAGQLSASGQRPNRNSFLVDGLSANNALTGSGLAGQFPGSSLPSMTAIGSLHSLATVREVREVRIQTSTFAPEFGRLPGAQVALETRSGSNELHGEAFFNLGNEALSANNWFANQSALPRAKSRLLDMGASVGGPLRENRTFFFANFEAMRLRQPYTMRVPVITAPRTDAVLRAFPSSPLANYSQPAGVTTGSLRLDHALGSRGVAFVRYKDTASDNENGFPQANAADFRTRSVTVGVTTALTPNVTNDTRINVSHASAESRWLSQLDLANAVPGPPETTLRALWIEGVGQLISGKGDLSRQSQWNMATTFAATKGRHQLRAGLDYQRLRPSRPEEFVAATAYWPSLDDYLRGTNMSQTTFYAPAGSSLSEAISLFSQDTWALTSRINLNYGVRWEFTPAPTYSATSGEPPPSVSPVLFPASGHSAPIWKSSYTQLAPRVGLAARLDSAGAFILRAGAGLFYDTGFVSANELLNGAPFNRWRTFLTPVVGIALDSTSIEYGYAPDLALPRTWQWNVTVERALGDGSAIAAGYVGASGRRLLRREGYALPGRTEPKTVLVTNKGSSSFHSLQVQYRRRMARSFSGWLSYTWGHSIDNGSWDSALFLVDESRGFGRDRGPSSFDARHSLNAALAWDLPGLLRGFSLSTIVRARTAFPVDPISSENAFGLAFDNVSRPDLVPGVPVWIDDPAAPGGRRLNRSAFRVRDDDRQGSLGRYALRGFGVAQLDASLQRTFAVRGASLRFRAEALNLTNRSHFADPVRYLSHSFFGEPAAMLNLMLGRGRPNAGLTPLLQTGGPRALQLSLQLRF